MKTKKINGSHFEKMLRNALANLEKHEAELNSLNVFPVADGDTGTNMLATLEYGLREAVSTTASGAYLKSLSDAMLLGAHGNSGVILSQLFRGIFLSLAHCGSVNPGELRNALIQGYKTAYSAVVRPVEGTILTVAREGIENIRGQIDRSSTIEDVLSLYIAEMRKSLSHTPEILPELREAGVVDSGALGYILLMEGMLGFLYGERIPSERNTQEKAPAPKALPADSLFNEDSLFTDGYCVEFVLQLLRGEAYSRHFALNRFISDLQDFGSSIVAVQNGSRVKVHIHTLKPAKVLGLGQEYGEFVSCKVENMQIQHNEVLARPGSDRAEKPFALISVADCGVMQGLFEELGSSRVLPGGKKMDVSVQDFVNALTAERAEKTVILPNNPNLIRVALQAKALLPEADIEVLETRTIPEGYSALAMMNPDEKSAEKKLRQLRDGFSEVITLSVATAEKAYQGENVSCVPGMQVAILDGRIAAAGEGAVSVLCQGLCRIPGIEEKESCIVFRGENTAESMEKLCAEQIRALFPGLELSFLYGGSPLYSWALALS